jgi:hypothetical protein
MGRVYSEGVRGAGGIVLGLLWAACAGAQTFGFENLADGTVLTNQYAGLTFSNAIVLSQGITLNEFEFPPHAGTNVASDNGGPMTMVSSTPLRSFSGYFTYGVALSIQAYGTSNNLLVSTTSSNSKNEALSGSGGANALLKVTASRIYKVVITGSPQGTSFTMDDVTVITPCDLNSDGAIDVSDVQAIIGEALGVSQAKDDLNTDGVVNVVDVQIVINGALNLGCASK